MIFTLMKYYNFYLFLLPFLIFWFVYIFYTVYIIFIKLSGKYRCIYFPEWTEWDLVNLSVVLPMRLSFELVYFISMYNFLSLNNIKNLLFSLIIIMLVGIPFIYAKIIYFYWKYREIYSVLEKLSKYKNLKLIILNGYITRNMKKTSESIIRESREVFAKASDKTILGLCITGRHTHAVVHDGSGGTGVTFTTKKQNIDEEFKIEDSHRGYAYVQKFGDNKGIIGMDKITNIDLREALTMRGVIYTLYANKILLTTNQKYFILNENNKQKLVEIQNFDILKSSKFISNCVGSLKVDNTMSYWIYYNNIILKSEGLLLSLANADRDGKIEILSKIMDLCETLKSIQGNSINSEDCRAEIILSKIQHIMTI